MGDKLTLKKSDFYDVKAYIYGKDKIFKKINSKIKLNVKNLKFK